MHKIISYIFIISFVLIQPVMAVPIKGIFGIPNIKDLKPETYEEYLNKGGVNSVFCPPDKDTIKWFKDKGFNVYISVDSFGAKGVCPDDQELRKHKIEDIKNLISDETFKIDGIWLDFIRYPGLWEVENPQIKETCSCRDAKNINSPYECMKWKKEQIYSFVKEVKEIIKKAKHPIKLGLFVVPWTKGEKNNDISYKLAQDPFELSKIADYISPMVYHKMCGHPSSWVGYMTKYYKEGISCEVVPIVQSVDLKKEELGEAIKSATEGDADGIIVYTFDDKNKDFLKELNNFTPPQNLIINPEPKCIDVPSNNDRNNIWSCPLNKGKDGVEYVFTGNFYREYWDNDLYPFIRIWDQEFHINNHISVKTYHPIKLYIKYQTSNNDSNFQFINRDASITYRLCNPRLIPNFEFASTLNPPVTPYFYKNFFPIGVYGATKDNLEQIKKLAINTVILGGSGKNLKESVLKCNEIGLKYVLSVPHEVEQLSLFLDEIKPYIILENLAFYVNDEPEIWSFPINIANDINRLIKDKFPKISTCMATVRPKGARIYKNASDFFMLDQYPVPFMPMTWLSDSMDHVAKELGQKRLISIIQAFGGENHKNSGWPRLPTWQEMNCLAFLSIIHGTRGIFFFTFNEIGATEEGKESLGRVIGRLNAIYPWLNEENDDQKIDIEMTSKYKFDEKGDSPIHCAIKKKDKKSILISANTIHTYVEANIKTDIGNTKKIKEIFNDNSLYPFRNNTLKVRFNPYEVKIFLIEE
ncbi:MAG: hypothetical protein HQK79_16320 [Desulfobacterales bacterium]|nr:hypothetical protein [Desulfobacterales bacterium]